MTDKTHSGDENLCAATVTTDSFIVGTLVTLYSFLKHNSWFKGEIVIICNELSEQNREYLRLVYDKIGFLQVGEELLSRVDEITGVFPEFRRKQARFFSLETFRLRNCERVLFLDSDLLFRASIADLFELEQPFIACGDGAFYTGRGRRWGAGIEEEKEIRVLYETFNSGFFLVDRSLLTDKIYQGLLALVDSRIYKTPQMKLTDQIVLNLYFAGRQYIASGAYNYLLAHRDSIFEREKITLPEARVLHFNGLYKPWMTEEVLTYGLRDAGFIKACGFWFEAYAECLQKLYLQAQTGQLRREEI